MDTLQVKTSMQEDQEISILPLRASALMYKLKQITYSLLSTSSVATAD
jgi:hypothetical protein